MQQDMQLQMTLSPVNFAAEGSSIPGEAEVGLNGGSAFPVEPELQKRCSSQPEPDPLTSGLSPTGECHLCLQSDASVRQ